MNANFIFKIQFPTKSITFINYIFSYRDFAKAFEGYLCMLINKLNGQLCF